MTQREHGTAKRPRGLHHDRRGLAMGEYAALLVLVLIAGIGAWRNLGDTTACTIGEAQQRFIQAIGGQAPADGLLARCAPRAGPERATRGPQGTALAALASSPPDLQHPLSAVSGVPAGGAIPANGPRPPTDPMDPPLNTGLGPDVEATLHKSPSTKANLQAFQARGGKIKFGPEGDGTYYDPDTDTVVLDDTYRAGRCLDATGKPIPGCTERNALETTAALAHELGHATYRGDGKQKYYAPDEKTLNDKDTYIAWNTNESLRNEASGVWAALVARDEILTATGGATDIGVGGRNAAEYQKSYDYYKNNTHRLDVDKETALTEIAKYWKTENPSEKPYVSYEQYYEDHFEQEWRRSGWNSAVKALDPWGN